MCWLVRQDMRDERTAERVCDNVDTPRLLEVGVTATPLAIHGVCLCADLLSTSHQNPCTMEGFLNVLRVSWPHDVRS